MLLAQGADLDDFNRKLARDSTAPAVLPLASPSTGVLKRCDARILGEVIRDIGGGRMKQDSQVNYDVGVDQLAKPGETIRAGDPLGRIHAATAEQARLAAERLAAAFEIADTPPPAEPLICETIDAGRP